MPQMSSDQGPEAEAEAETVSGKTRSLLESFRFQPPTASSSGSASGSRSSSTHYSVWIQRQF